MRVGYVYIMLHCSENGESEQAWLGNVLGNSPWPLVSTPLGKSRPNSPCYLTGFRKSCCHDGRVRVIYAGKQMMSSRTAIAFLSHKQISRDSV